VAMPLEATATIRADSLELRMPAKKPANGVKR